MDWIRHWNGSRGHLGTRDDWFCWSLKHPDTRLLACFFIDVWRKHTLTLRRVIFYVVVLLFGELVGRPAGTKLQKVFKMKTNCGGVMYDTTFSFIIHIVQAPRAESRKLAYCVEEGLFFLSSRCADMCWSRRRPEGPWTPHGARLWHRWYLIDVQEKGAQTKHNYIFNDYVFFTPLLEDGAWLQNRKSFTFKHISVTFNTLGKHKPWQENQVWSWAEPETMKVGRELSDMRFHTPQHRSSHALVSLLLNFMICIEFIHVLKCVRDQNMNNADPAGDLKRRHVTTIQRAWRCCNWNHWV